MLTRNGSNISIKGRLLGASPATALRDSSLTGNPLPRVHCGGLSRYASLPVGYRNEKAYIPAQSPGGFSSILRISGTASLTSTVSALGTVSASLTAASSLTSSLTALKNITCTITGTASSSLNLLGRANISATIRIGANPSADDIAITLLDTYTVNGSGVTVRQALRRAMSAAENAFATGA